MLHFTNTFTQKKEIFAVQNNKKVAMYVCGITPYDYAHIGHGRCYVTFDLVYRLLTFLRYKVTYTRNFTDIDDKIIKRAEHELHDATRYLEIANRYIKAFGRDIKSLNCLPPSYEPCVTQTIPQIIAFVQGLIKNGTAYEIDGSIYFRVATFAAYGQLSKQNIEQLQSGARVEVDSCKENPLDFALWKKDDIVGFESPWGKGRPGWHIECSAMAHDIFKGSVDIHGGGMDLMFPHHENEIAQSESLYPAPFVRLWLHNAFVRINKEKMSKSLGNFFTLHEMFEQFDPMILRFYFLKHHYRNPLDFSFEDVTAAETTYKRLVNFFDDVCEKSIHDVTLVKKNLVVADMLALLEDDLNTSGMFGILFDKMPMLQDDAHAKALVKYFLVHVLGLTLEPIAQKSIEITPEIQELLRQREIARAVKDWKRSDELRNQLQSLGIDVHDKKLK
ncbi:cysteine--tRNA ligase [Candidatus Babeliales bacterium]|nr:cysteine--tRNA ligase [Candidatus Babeliales bacterium]